jgi:polyhydroxyalkanoate synthesis repressor PhaR
MSESAQTETGPSPVDTPPVVVKKYANRRLYNTESSSYITLDNLAEMVRQGKNFVVYDAKTGEDITRGVLTQIIVEEESKGRAMLPTGFLRQLIGLYGDSMQTVVPRYLEQALSAFSRQQDQIRTAMQQAMGPFFPYNIDELNRQNRAMLERTITLFNPFLRPPAGPGEEPQPESPAAPGIASEEVAMLRAEVERLRRELSRYEAASDERSNPPKAQLRKVPSKP